jgi:hypothetical protein
MPGEVDLQMKPKSANQKFTGNQWTPQALARRPSSNGQMAT